MTDIKKITVTATRVGFIDGRRVRPGEVFTIDERRYSAKWMAKAGEAVVLEKPKPNGDIKPKEARIAVEAKAKGAAGLV